jgi:hypothetical protein
MAMALLAERGQRRGLTIRIEHVRDAPGDALTDEAQLEQAVSERLGVGHPEHVPLGLQTLQNPVSGRLCRRG